MSLPIKVLYEDEQYIVFDKPPGLLVIPTAKHEKHTLVDLVNRPASPAFNSINSPRLHPCHRLDRDTSGVILFAKGKINQQRMMEEFKQKRVQKVYLAFVRGKLKNPAGEIKSVISDVEERRFHRHAPARLSITRYKTLAVRKYFSVAEVYPITGRTNQIRIHFSEIGHPILGERKFAFGKDFALKFRRTALHAQSLKWFHPFLKKEIQVESPLAEDMKELWKTN